MKDSELAAKAIAGNDNAFLTLMFMHKETLFRTALAYLKNEEDALEAVQEVTFRAYQKINTLRNPEYVKTWLIRIMMNYCRDILQKQKRLIFDEGILSKFGIDEDYTYLEVEEALATLSNEQRDLVSLKYLHGVKIKDIAEMTFTPEGTVKTRLYKALSSLRLFFEGKGGIRRV